MVIGAGLAGAETAMAIRQRLPQSAVALVGDQLPGHGRPASFQQQLQAQLRATGVTCIQARVRAVSASEVTLDNGTRMACDVPLVATGPEAPYWLQHSGLNLDEHGFVQVEPTLRSSSHAHVFAAGDVRTRLLHETARHLAQARSDARTLAHNLYATVAGRSSLSKVRTQTPRSWVDTLAGQALVGERLVLQGRVAGWLKRWHDARLIHRWRRP